MRVQGFKVALVQKGAKMYNGPLSSFLTRDLSSLSHMQEKDLRMYLSDSNDRAIVLPSLPKPADMPPLIAISDIEFRFAYPIASDFFLQRGSFLETEQDGLFVEVVRDESLLSQEHLFDVYALWEGGIWSDPKQKLLRAHPLAERGIFPCGVFEVKPSSWLHHLQSIEPEHFPSEIVSSYHPATQTRTMRQVTYHHVLFTFRDTTLEFITNRLSYELFQGSQSVREEMLSIKWGADAYYGQETADALLRSYGQKTDKRPLER